MSLIKKILFCLVFLSLSLFLFKNDILAEGYCSYDYSCPTGYEEEYYSSNCTGSYPSPYLYCLFTGCHGNNGVNYEKNKYEITYEACFKTGPTNCYAWTTWADSTVATPGHLFDPLPHGDITGLCDFSADSHCNCLANSNSRLPGVWDKDGTGCSGNLYCNTSLGWYSTCDLAWGSLPTGDCWYSYNSCQSCDNSGRACFKKDYDPDYYECQTNSDCASDECCIKQSTYSYCSTDCSTPTPTPTSTCACQPKSTNPNGCANIGGTCGSPDRPGTITTGLCTCLSDCVCVSCTPDCSASGSYCPSQTFDNGCGGTCTGTKPVVNGGWSTWSTCSSCSQTRTCNNPAPSCGGLQCLKLDGTRGLTETRSCNVVTGTAAVCGTAISGSTCTAPTTSLCSTGTVTWNDQLGSDGRFNWTCNGTAGTCGGADGADVACSSDRAEVNGAAGVCGTADTALGYCASTDIPTATRCIDGTVASIGTSSPYFVWTCPGDAGSCGGTTGASARCVTPDKPTVSRTTPVCGRGTTEVFSVPPTTSLCSVGIASTVVTNTSTYTWSCVGTTGTCPTTTALTANCSVIRDTPPTLLSFLIKNLAGATVPPELGVGTSRNHICQPVFTSQTARFELKYVDAQGVSDVNVGLKLGTNTFNPTTTTTVGTTQLVANFDIPTSAVSSTAVQRIDIRGYDDNAGVGISAWQNTNRYFKYWDCLVDVGGTGYDGSADNNDCPDDTTNQLAISYSLIMNDVGPGAGADKTMTVVTPNYYSGSNNLVWKRNYILTATLAGDAPNVIRFNKAANCSNSIQFTVDDTIADPYDGNPSFIADFSSVVDQEPWWQTDNGGVISDNLVINRVPVTCPSTDAGCWISPSGAILSVQTIINNNKTTNQVQPWYYKSNTPLIQNTNYAHFYDQYYTKNGIGRVLTGNQVIPNANIGSTGIYFISGGNLTINENKTISNPSDFLMLIVDGDINVSSNVLNVDGILVARNIGASGSNDSPLTFNGSLYASNNINFTRSFSDKEFNNASPAVVVRHNPRLIFNLPGELSKVLTNWQWGN